MSFIDDKYAALGGAGGFLGAPDFPEERITPNGLGAYRHYAGGSIYGRFSTQLACEVHGLIRQRWAELGWENFGGFPVTDEVPVPPNVPRGRANDFEGMVISWSPATGAHEVYGAILRRWRALGREGGILGFPTTGESGTPDGRGRYNHFEGGSIYWTPQTGAHEVVGQFRQIWGDGGWENGPLGYPTSPGEPPLQLAGSTVTFQEFEKGRLFLGVGGVFSRVSLPGSPAIFTVPGTSINWNSFGLPLPDGDRIAFVHSGNPGNNPNRPITITLRAGPGITWWKAISLWSPTSGDIREASTQNGPSASFTVTAAELESGSTMLVFKKAKFLGVHTPMYWLSPLIRLLGTDVTFTWLKD